MSPSGSPGPSCPASSDFCHSVYNLSHKVWLAESSYWMLVKPLRIVLFIAVALLVRFLIHRFINRVIRHTIDAGNGNLLAPLRDRITPALRAAAVVPSERRRQRTQALGSVLRSIASATVLAVTVMLILAEIGVNLGPILASAGIIGIAVGLGAQNLVRDFLAGMFILAEDQFGVGDMVDLGQAGVVVSGTVEAVGLRITTLRDDRGALWYIRNGEIMRVGNKSQGWALVVVDVQVGFAFVTRAAEVLREATAAFAADPEWADELLAPPEMLGIEEIVIDATVFRITAKTSPETQFRMARDLRRRVTDALTEAGLNASADTVQASTAETVGPQSAEPGTVAPQIPAPQTPGPPTPATAPATTVPITKPRPPQPGQ